MEKKLKKIILSFYIVILFLLFFNIDYLNPLNTLWLYNDNPDNAAIQAGWYFFKNDIWRFPLGLNPNYGHGLNNTIIVSDGIPILAILFKLLAPLAKFEYQYISSWYLLCFILQFYFAFKIINFFTKNFYFSFIAANFFILAPVFLYRLTLDPVQSAHWILLWFLYNLFKYKFELTEKKILLILLVSVSINIYFVAIISVPIFFFFFFKFFYNLEKKTKIIKKFLIIYSSLLFLMFLLGYFVTPISSSVGGGFGVYNLNLLTIFDPVVQRRDQIWSNFFSSINISQNSKVEAFNYLGLGQFCLILTAFFILFKRRNILKIFFNFERKYLIFLGTFLFFLFLIALSNKIYFGDILLLEIKLNNYILGILSIFRVSARFFWLVTYLVLAISLLIIFFEFKKKKYLILLFCFSLQLIDTFPGLKKNFKHNFDSPIKNFENFNDIFSTYQIINISYPENYSNKFIFFSGYFEKFRTVSTNFSVQARFNRKKAAQSRDLIYKKLFSKDIKENEVIIIENISHLKHLKTKFKKDEFVFLLRNNFWFLAKKGKLKMSEFEKRKIDDVKLDPIIFGRRLELNLEKPKYFGLGWTYPREYNHIDNKLGAWSEGNKSSLLFRLNNNEKIFVTFFYEANIQKKNYEFLMEVSVNDINYKKFLINSDGEKTFSLNIDPKNLNSRDIIIDFNFSNIKSSWEQAYKPDFRSLGIKLKSIQFEKNN